MHYKFFAYNDHIVLFFFQEILVLMFPTHKLSLEFVLGFCHKIAKGGDYKVEFNQLSYWLYSVPNLLVIQHLETLYLSGNQVRVVCERV